MASDKLLREAWRRYLLRCQPCEWWDLHRPCDGCPDPCYCPIRMDDSDFHAMDDLFDRLAQAGVREGADPHLAANQYAYEVWQGWRSARWDDEEG